MCSLMHYHFSAPAWMIFLEQHVGWSDRSLQCHRHMIAPANAQRWTRGKQTGLQACNHATRSPTYSISRPQFQSAIISNSFNAETSQVTFLSGTKLASLFRSSVAKGEWLFSHQVQSSGISTPCSQTHAGHISIIRWEREPRGRFKRSIKAFAGAGLH